MTPQRTPIVWSVDEKTATQAKSRLSATRPAVPGKPVRQEPEHRRSGTVSPFGAPDLHEDAVRGWVTGPARSENSVASLPDLVAYTPAGLQPLCICDDCSAHTPGRPAKQPLPAPSSLRAFPRGRLRRMPPRGGVRPAEAGGGAPTAALSATAQGTAQALSSPSGAKPYDIVSPPAAPATSLSPEKTVG